MPYKLNVLFRHLQNIEIGVNPQPLYTNKKQLAKIRDYYKQQYGIKHINLVIMYTTFLPICYFLYQ